MIIKGIYGGKKNRGEIKELSPDEKVTEALQAALTRRQAGFEEYLVSVLRDSVKLSNKTMFAPKGYALKKHWQNNTYSAKGEALLRRQHIGKGYVMEPKKYTFDVKFEDTLDDWGQPDLKVTTVSFTPKPITRAA